jgi:hypothetical protein
LKTLIGLKNRINARHKTGSRYIKGSQAELEKIIEKARRKTQTKFEIVLVQPGISQSKMEGNIAMVLAAADRFIISNNCEKLKVWGSA